MKQEKPYYIVYMECLGGDEPARDMGGAIGYNTGGNEKIHKFHTLNAAKEYAEFNDEYIMSNSGEYFGNGSICSECRGTTPEYTGGACGSCLDWDFTK